MNNNMCNDAVFVVINPDHELYIISFYHFCNEVLKSNNKVTTVTRVGFSKYPSRTLYFIISFFFS